MPDIIKSTDTKRENAETKRSQLLWFIGLYCAGLIVTGVAVFLLRTLMGLN
jgi:hypothetical protein